MVDSGLMLEDSLILQRPELLIQLIPLPSACIFFLKLTLYIIKLFMNRLIILIICTFAILNYLTITQCQSSTIESAQKIQPSIVSIHAVQFLINSKISPNRINKKGAGVIVSPDGMIVTNFHTVQGADQLGVRLHNNKIISAKIIQLIPEEDLALIKMDYPLSLTPITLADSDQLNVGDTVLHIGHSFLLDGTISQGRITGLGTSLKAKKLGLNETAVIRVNLNLYQGDSGGPLLNQQGQLIGMTAAKDVTKNRTSYAIPANKIKNILLNYSE